MTWIYSIFRADTGEYLRTVTSPNEADIDLNTRAGEVNHEGDHPFTYLNGGTITPLPTKPGEWAEWDGETWIDPRTPGDIQAALYAAREATSLDKSDLLIRMATAGMLPPEDAEIAAGGIIPPTIQTALDALPVGVFPLEAQMVARIKWRSDNVISRVNPVIVLAAAALGVTDEQMDAVFGVRIPEGL